MILGVCLALSMALGGSNHYNGSDQLPDLLPFLFFIGPYPISLSPQSSYPHIYVTYSNTYHSTTVDLVTVI